MPELMTLALAAAVGAPLAASIALGVRVLLSAAPPTESEVTRLIGGGLAVSLAGAVASVFVAYGWLGGLPQWGEIDYGSWLRVGGYRIPAAARVDGLALSFAVLGAWLTVLVGRFSRTYLHKEPGFTRFFLLLGMFAGGVQLVAFAGAMDLFFAGWELIGISSALFIGFFHERDEPMRSSVRAFTTYRLCDAGFLMAMVSVHEVLGTTRFAALEGSAALPVWETTTIAALFMLAAMGKSAMLPFSGWLPRAMEGPTPSSALFYGALSIHMGLFLLLRIQPMLAAAPAVELAGVVIGSATAVYAAAVARVHSDAKGALAHATLAQVGLIFAEICLGLTTLATAHIAGHALLRVYQFLRAPNTIHDAHRLGHAHAAHAAHAARSPHAGRALPSAFARRSYAAALHRLRLEDRLDALVSPAVAFAGVLDRWDRRLRRLLTLPDERSPGTAPAGPPLRERA
jgi:NADH-quinone oxidoreductase subunit L